MATINLYCNTLRSLFKKAVEWNMIAVNPTANLKPLKVNKEAHDVYTKEQVMMLLQAA
ncbi:hypothetical protein DFP93_105120 [Aneurinibacillus soli]|uniref:Uncharacterized protein n=1 Tax=Aneurinibacillus soli TaxID=1500254 RepID=A0A0U5BAG9_9BACL|nr:hypothetical protein [Aneurinibacillus soli]PYE62166.1 hypothetical protein DFP93_105120 [Aneurinibacillus soli]BAU28646.1 hypothetical protein CB4_02821 [Aneurinibacillus soli]